MRPHFPADWQGNAITCDFRAHRIVRFALEDLSLSGDATGDGRCEKRRRPARTREHRARAEPPASTRQRRLHGQRNARLPPHERRRFRPIDIRLGPDGALYIADWSNPVINHGEVDFRDPRRDKERGRIWRVTKKDTPPVKWEPLVAKKNEELLQKLVSENLWEKEQARRIISAGTTGRSRRQSPRRRQAR